MTFQDGDIERFSKSIALSLPSPSEAERLLSGALEAQQEARRNAAP